MQSEPHRYQKLFACRSAIVGFCCAEILIAWAVLSEQNPFAIYSLVFSPLRAIPVAFIAAVLGALVGRIAFWRKVTPRRPFSDIREPVLILIGILAGLVSVLLFEIRLQTKVSWLRTADTASMRNVGLEQASVRELAALVQNPRCCLDLVDKVVELDRRDLMLSTKPWWWPSVSRGPSVMELIAQRKRVHSRTLQKIIQYGSGSHVLSTLEIAVAGNVNCRDTCVSMLVARAESAEDALLKRALARNSNLPQEVSRRWAKEGGTFLLSELGANPGIPPDVIEALSDHPDSMVRLAVASNGACSADILKRLAGDANDSVSRAAKVNVERRGRGENKSQKDRHNP